MSEIKPDNASSAAQNAAENKTSHAEHHRQLDEKYPTKRGFWDVVAKNGFLLLTHIFCDMKCIGKENFPANNPYVVASNHQSYPDGVLIIDYLPKGHFKWMCCLAASDLETQHGKLGRLIMRVGRGIAVDRYGNPVRGLIKAKKEVEQGNICFVFPEGTRTHTGKLAELKDGASYLAIKANVPLVTRSGPGHPSIPILSTASTAARSGSTSANPCTARISTMMLTR